MAKRCSSGFAVSEQPLGLLTQEIEIRFLVWLRKHKLKNGETCEWTTNRFVHQLEEIDIDFRVSGWPHAVVKQAENFRVL